MTIELAPMEGITTALFRRAYKKWFKEPDWYYTPFIAANQTHKFKTRERQEVEPYTDKLTPQILTDKAEHFIWAAGKLKEKGYQEINLNAGCPSATVTTKGKGAGMLGDLSKLEAFLDEVFSAKERGDIPEVSVKTRVGVASYDEAEGIASLYSRYPFSKVIVHPRIRDDYYNNSPNMEAFKIFYDRIRHERLVINGDLKTAGDIEGILKSFPDIGGVMIGRGILADPFLPEKIRTKLALKEGADDEAVYAGLSDRDREMLFGFLEELHEQYLLALSDDRAALFKMKDIWNFTAAAFPDQERQLRAIIKSRNGQEYKTAVRSLRGFIPSRVSGRNAHGPTNLTDVNLPCQTAHQNP